MDISGLGAELQRIFIGEESLLFLGEIAFRTAFMYLYVLLAARLIGKRGIGQLTPVEYIIVIALGSATGDPMFYPDIPLIHGMVVITVIVLLQKAFLILSNSSDSLERKLESEATKLIHSGKLATNALKNSGLSREEVKMELRLQGIKYFGEVEEAYLEPAGRVSILRASKGKYKAGESTLPARHR